MLAFRGGREGEVGRGGKGRGAQGEAFEFKRLTLYWEGIFYSFNTKLNKKKHMQYLPL